MKRLTLLFALAAVCLAAAAFAVPDQPVPFAPVQDGPVAAAPQVLPWLPDRLIVQFTPDALAASGLAAADKAGRTATSTGLPGVDAVLADQPVAAVGRAFFLPGEKAAPLDPDLDRWYRIDLDGPADIPALAARLAAQPGVAAALPDYRLFPAVVPNDPDYPDNWGHANTGQLPDFGWGTTWDHTGPGVGTVGFDANADQAWDGAQGYGDGAVVIAIIDSGVDTGHPDLNLVAGYDFGDGDSDPDDNAAGAGHGTCCAGVAAAIANNGLGVAGVAGGCAVMPLKIADAAGNLSLAAAVNAVNYAAANGADVISMSFGAALSLYAPMDTALQNAFDAGCVILAATGNENAGTISYPAINFNTIAVGAASPCGDRKRSSNDAGEVNPGVNTDPNDYTCDGERWWGSNYGYNRADDRRAVDILAPTILPTTDITGAGGFRSGDYEPFFNGTSCATPYAAGVAALVKSANPTWTASQIRDQLRSTAIDVVNVESAAGWDRYSGYGLVDAAAAVGAGGPVAPVAAFSGVPAAGCAPLLVTFSDASTGDADAWSWDFGDGGTSAAQNPTHTYTAPGDYDVTLAVSGPAGADTLTVAAYVSVGGPPTAGFTASPTGGPLPLLVVFTDTSTGATDWAWDFGDGGADVSPSPVHTYTSYGTFTVRQIATNACGADTVIAVDLVTVAPPAPAAAFSLDPGAGCAPLQVAFTDGSGGSIDTWAWDFGDGGSSAEQNPIHVYAAAGSYDVRLVVAGTGGADTLTVAGAVEAGTAVTAAFALSDTLGAPPLGVTFTDQSTGGALGWLWDFGDGGTDTVQHPVHQYLADGTYTVTLVVTGGCSADTLTVADAVLVSSLSAVGARVPTGFGLAQNYPNPFNPSTTITYAVTRPGPVRLEVYDTAGRRVAVLVDEERPAGEHSVLWQPRGLASGVYFARFAADGRSETRRLVLLK